MNVIIKILLLFLILFFISCGSNPNVADKLTKEDKILYDSFASDNGMSHEAKIKLIENSKKIKEQNQKIDALNKDIIVLSGKVDNLEKYVGNKILEDNKTIKKDKNEITYFKPSTFVLIADSDIFSSIKDKVVIKRWKKGKKFTSFSKIGNWYKISGYFIKSGWKRNDKNLWIEDIYIKKIY